LKKGIPLDIDDWKGIMPEPHEKSKTKSNVSLSDRAEYSLYGGTSGVADPLQQLCRGSRRAGRKTRGSDPVSFLAYATVGSRLIVAVLYILDHVFFNFAIAIRTYFQKIGDPRDIAPSMAVGFTINHMAAVFLPAIGGLLWMVDYRIPFVAGAEMSLVSLIAVQRIRFFS